MFGRKKSGGALLERMEKKGLLREQANTRNSLSGQHRGSLRNRTGGQQPAPRKQRGLSITEAGGQCNALPGESVRAYKKRMEKLLSISARRELNVLHERTTGRRLW